MKVYIVTSGEYSDYQIESVFSDKEKAEKYIDTHDSDMEIEEYDLDYYKEKDIDFYEVVISEYKGENSNGCFSKAGDNEIKDSFSTFTLYGNTTRYWYFYIACNSGKKAIKIASERLMAIKANSSLYKGLYDTYRDKNGMERDSHSYNFFTLDEIKNK